jgi:tetratricopeptide (TPR) repeat protein
MKHCIRYSIIWALLFVPKFVGAQNNYEFNRNCTEAYHAAISLKLDGSRKLIEQEKKENPDNIIPYFLENYLDFFELFLNEDPKQFAALKENKKKRLAIVQKGPDNSPLKGFMQSVIYLHWAAVDIKFGNRMSAGFGFRDALKTIKENQKRFPQFTPNLMISGPVQMTASTVPKGYKWLSSLVGISGNMATGKKQMDTFLAAKDPWATLFRDEGIFYFCYLQFYLLNEPDYALEYIAKERLDLVNNHLFTFMAANLYLNNKQSEKTKTIVYNRNKSNEYMRTTVWDFELAYAHLFHLDAEAEKYFKQFLQQFKGSYYVKDAWHKLSFHYLIHGKKDEYNKAIKMVLTVGKQDAEADKRAYKEASSGKVPNVTLLKARLLNDGGYHKEALQVLAGKSSKDFPDAKERLEFTYRLGRIYDDFGLKEKAIEAYDATYNNGKNFTEYYAARAAWQAGLIYEDKKQCAKAIEYYKKCVDLEGHDFENSLEQKAKAGIERCKNKM